MKRFLLIFLISFTSLFGQKLKFDVMAKYITSSEKPSFEKSRSAYAISTNDNYIMQILNEYNGHQVAQVYDLKSLKMHQFDVEESKSENGIINYKFIYSNTRKFERTPVKDIYFDFQSVSIKDNVETVNLIFYKNKSKTKIVNVLELKILKSEVNLFPLFRYTCLHPSEFITELNYINGGLVTNCTTKNGSTKYILKAIEETNFEITIPN